MTKTSSLAEDLEQEISPDLRERLLESGVVVHLVRDEELAGAGKLVVAADVVGPESAAKAGEIKLNARAPTISKPIVCIVSGYDRDWEAFCLDFDLAVQGRSFEDARSSLNRAIEMYIETATAQPEPIRSRLLARRAPFLVRLGWALRVFWSAFRTRATRSDRDHPVTIEYLACPA